MFTVLLFSTLSGFLIVVMLRSYNTLLTVELTFVSPTFIGHKIPNINLEEVTMGRYHVIQLNSRIPRSWAVAYISFGRFHHVKTVKMIPLVFLSLQSLHQKLNVHCRGLLHSKK